VSGLNITIPTDRVNGLTDIGRMSFVGLQMVRESDGDTAMVTAMPDDTDIDGGISTTRVTIDAQPSPSFAQADVIYFRSPDDIYEGDADWKGRPDDAAINPAYAQDYREINFFTDDVLGLRAQGIWRDAWAPWEKYVARANQPAIPGLGRDYPAHTDNRFAEDFYRIHGPTVLGSYPVVITRTVIAGTGASGTNLTATPAVAAPSTGLTRTYQWYNNGAAISGATSTTYAVVAGDIGDSLTVWETITNSEGTAISRSAAVLGNSGYVVNAVNATTAYGTALPITGVAPATQGSFVFTFRQNSAWQPGTYFVNGTNAAGSARFRLEQLSNRNFSIAVFNSSATAIAYGDVTTNHFNVGSYYTVAVSWDTVTQAFVARSRIDGGSWVTMPLTGTGFVASGICEPLGRLVFMSASGASGALNNCDVHDFWLSFGQKPDFTDSAVLAKFLPTVSKGATGSLPTGTAPDFYFSGEGSTTNFRLNRGTASGLMTTAGTLTTAGVQPT
jgi:hypothetical protein